MPGSQPAKRDRYAAVGTSGLDAVVQVEGASDGEVSFFQAGGGFVRRCSVEKFLETHAPVTQEQIRAWGAEYRRAHFDGDWFPAEAPPIEGYTNGVLWNGWQVPSFSREALEAGIAAGGICGPDFGSDVFYDESGDAFVHVATFSGNRLPDDLDREAILELLAQGKDEILMNGEEISIGVNKGLDITVDGSPLHVYGIGSGWCWSVAPAMPGPTSAPGR